jgi:2-iminoacetate synthase ThiH
MWTILYYDAQQGKVLAMTRLEPIAAKVLAGERLDFDDGLALYGSPDVLAVGWLANHVRERMHGDVTYFNVNRHINPTNVCVAACKLCAFGRKKGDPAGYTMALEEAWETAASGLLRGGDRVPHRRRAASRSAASNIFSTWCAG